MATTYKATYWGIIDGKRTVFLYNTAILRWDYKVIELDNGGWITATTCRRMNMFSDEQNLGFHVYIKGGKMYCNYDGATYPFGDDGKLNLRRPDPDATPD